jgi:hypothetical protein
VLVAETLRWDTVIEKHNVVHHRVGLPTESASSNY